MRIVGSRFSNGVSYFLLIASIFFILGGCSSLTTIPSTSTGDNPFSSDFSSSEEVMFAYGFGLETPPAEINMVYDGEEIHGEYFIDNIGSPMKTGTLIFVNGFPQTYRVEGGEETYMHIQDAEGNQKTTVKFSFEPVCGKAGDILSVRFLSLLNPHIKPNIQNYMFGHTNAMTTFFPRYIEMEKDSPTQLSAYPYLAAQRDMTQDEINQVIYVDARGRSINKLSSFNIIVRNPTDPSLPYLSVNNGCVSFEVQGYGGPQADYVLIPYINHSPVVNDIFPSILCVESGTKIFSERFVLDISELNTEEYNITDYNTFFILAIPVDGSTMLDPVKSSCFVIAEE